MAVGPSAPPIMAMPAAWLGSKPKSQGNHVGAEDSKLGSGSNQDELRVGNECREVGHGSNAQEYEWRVPALFHSLVEDVQNGVVFV